MDIDKWKQGQAFFGDKIGNAWLYNPELLKLSTYLIRIKTKNKHIWNKSSTLKSKEGNRNKLSEEQRPGRDPRAHIGAMHLHEKPENKKARRNLRFDNE